MNTKSKKKKDLQKKSSDEMSFLSHLSDLKSSLKKSLSAIFIIFFSLCFFSQDLFHLLAEPLINLLPEGGFMIATSIINPYFIPLKFTFILSVFLSIPIVFYFIWSFVAPGLHKIEKRMTYYLLISSSVLFYLGVLFAYFVAMPMVFAFLVKMAPEHIAIMPDINEYLNFCTKFFFGFGLAFNTPVVTFFLVNSGIISTESLSGKRGYVILIAFVVGMLLTPPDVVSQTIIAIPIWLLFEVGLLFTRLVKLNQVTEQDDSISV